MLQRKVLLRALALMLVASFLLPLLVACSEEELEEDQIAVTWHHGMVSSAAHTDSPEQLLDGVDDYSYSDIIHIEKKGTTLTFCDYNTEDMIDTERAGEDVYVISHWVEQNGTWVLDTPGDNYEGKDGRAALVAKPNTNENYILYKYTSTYDNEYVRLCYRSGETAKNARKIDFAKVYLKYTGEKGTFISDTAYYTKITVEKYLINSKDESWYSALEGLNVVVIGDSYFDDSAVKDCMWIDLLARKYDMELDNHGISGSTVSNDTAIIQSSSHNSYGKPKALNPMTERLTYANAKKALLYSSDQVDLVLFDGGRNDFTREVNLGSASLENTNKATFCGAVNYCIDRLQELFPNALIIGITVWGHEQTNQITGLRQEDFGNAMMEMCALQGIPCFNSMDRELTGVDMDNAYFRSQYCKTASDISHLNAAGMMNFMPVMEKYIAEQYTAFLANK